MDKKDNPWKAFFKPFIPILLLLLVFGLSTTTIIQVNYFKQLSRTSQEDILLETDLFQNEMNSQTSNILYLSDITARARDHFSENRPFEEALIGVFSDFVYANAIYDQIRFLDLNGMEVARINHSTGQMRIVPDYLLQDKSDRYYFKEAVKLDIDEIYISRFDLNVEYDIIEIPHKPVYRLITPVDNKDGDRFGYIVLNILGQSILDLIIESNQHIPGDIYLINEDGYWLIGPEGTTPWGFMYDDTKNVTFKEKFPDIWSRYNGKNIFQGLSINGLFTFEIVDPTNQENISSNTDIHGGLRERWILVSHTKIAQLISQASVAILITTISVVIILFFSFQQVAKNRWNENIAFKAREESEKKLEIISDASKDAIIFINSRGLIEYWSQSAEKMFGFSAAEAKQQEIHKLIAMHQNDRDEAYKGMKKYTQTGQSPVLNKFLEVDAVTKDGQLIPVEISINPVRIEDEWWAMGIIRDISEREKAKKEILELARFPMENTNAVMRVDKKGILLFANPAADYLLQTWKLHVGKQLSNPMKALIIDAIATNMKKEKRIRINKRIYLFIVFPVVESGYANIYGADVSEEERSRKKLEDSELKYRSLLNAMPQYIFHKDKKGKYITVNDSLAKLMKMDPSEVVGKTDFDLYSDDLARKHQKNDREVLELGIPIEFDEPFYPNQTDKSVAHMVKSPLFNKKGEGIGILGVFWDITKRVEAEINLAELNKNLENLVQERTNEIEVINKELSISEKRYRAIIESQVEFVFRWDMKGNITYTNQSFSRRYEKKAKDIEGLFYKNVIPSDAMDELYNMMGTITKEKPILTTEIRNIFPNEKIVWEQWNSRAIFNEKNEIIEIQNVGRDITALKQAQEQVYIQSSALEAAANGIVITDTNGTVVWANQAISRLTGYALKELIGKNPRIFKSGQMDEESYRDLWKTILNNKVWSGEMINRKKDGSFYTEEMTITPVSTENGEISSFIAIKQDITKRKEIESEIQKAKEQAELANRAKSTFLANMSHEIRTPLNAIMGLNYLLKRTGISDIQEKYLDKMHSASKTLLDTINDVLDFSKIEAEKIEIENVTFDLDSIMLDITDTEALKAHQKGIELIISIEEGIPERIEGDPIRLKQVLRNLTNNAIKFTDKGEVVIEILKVNEEKNKITLQFSVSDTGIGLNPEQIEGLFTAFQQADISITRKYGGSGLGLAISKRIVQLMNGKIWVKSEIGKGSIFSFTIPFGKVAPKKRKDLFLSKEVVGKKVLIIDSNSKSSQWLARLLKPTQAEITQVCDINTLQEILEPIESEMPFDVVLVNNNVKGFRRLEDLTGIKDRFPAGNIRVVHLTDTVQFAQRVSESASNSIDAIMIKPINASQLYDTWISMFSSKKAKRRTKKQPRPKKPTAYKFEGVKILLVEDNEINQEVIQELLVHNGAEIVIAENGKIALQRLEQEAFDLILMDIQMPVMDGFTTSKEIRKNQQYATLPIIALTANSQIEEKKMAKKAGMNDYITKPIEPKLLFQIIEKWTKREIPADNLLSSEKENQLLKIQGVDTHKGLTRLNHDVPTYVALLTKFVQNHENDIQKIVDLTQKHEWDQAKSITHAVRGAAANLSVDSLMKSLETIEQAIKNKDIKIISNEAKQSQRSFRGIAKDLQILNNELKRDTSKNISKLPNKKDLLKRIKHLQNRIKDNDPEAKSIIREINKVVPSTQYRGLLAAVQISLEAYDFQKSLIDLNRIIEMINSEDKK